MAKSTWSPGDTFQASDENAIATEVTADTAAIAAIKAVTGLLKSNGTTVSAATAGTDYSVPTGTETLTTKTLTSPVINGATITGYTETVNALGTVTTTKTIPALSGGTVLTATLTASTGCTFTMPTATAGQSFTLQLKQPSTTGNGTATFTGVKWSGGVAPTITAAAGQMDILSFSSDGTNWYGSYVQGFTY